VHLLWQALLLAEVAHELLVPIAEVGVAAPALMPHPVFDDLLEGARGRRRLQRRQELGEEARVPRRCHKDLPLRAAQQQHLLRGGRHRGGSRSRVGMGRRGAESIGGGE
jgi:hypothetical protein